ncbi:Uncharacterized damage-inducible protein DinB (forms a four-helix bundle) [Chitinophaga sp. YR573]|uniref:DinB family protein n=1 Tax=Chitinophaga sp. YR573 TaxID=1881040 RepID=UPI0008CF862C|nr:DinB family protein [Chitinophaga sp. YR573]SEW01539.1 Uncharacterized damage-inducible protein DinB (forms a four-helix bundle) [Chitinophaga sp. YR573]
MPEVWMRGPVADVPALLQPVAHALLQAQEEIHALVSGFPDELLWQQPAGVAAVGFHLQHITGVLDRMYTYAAGQALSEAQLAYLSAEGKPAGDLISLLTAFDTRLQTFVDQLKNIDESNLTAARTVGRKQLPTTLIGLLFHAAEHTMRHTGQLHVTVRVIQHLF